MEGHSSHGGGGGGGQLYIPPPMRLTSSGVTTMGFDPWAQTNQGLQNLQQTMGTLAQLKRQDMQHAMDAEDRQQRRTLADIQIKTAQQGLDDQTALRSALSGAKGGYLYPEPAGVGPMPQGQESSLSNLGPQQQPASAQDRLKVMGDLASQGNTAAAKQLPGAIDLDAKIQQMESETIAGGGDRQAFLQKKMQFEQGKEMVKTLAPLAQHASSRPLAMKLLDGYKQLQPDNPFIQGMTPDSFSVTPEGMLAVEVKTPEGKVVGYSVLDPETNKMTMLPPQKPDQEAMMDKRFANQQKLTQMQIDAADRRAAKKGTGGSGHGGMNIKMNGLSPEQTTALTAAIGEGRLDPYKINSKNQQILADAAVANPGINLNDMAANLGLARNKDVQMKGAIAETVPPLLKSIVDNGKKLNYSNNQFLGMAQQWIDKKSNNPQFVKYMSLRNDQLLTLGGIMRSNGMTDMAQKLEEEAAQPTMSPRALEGWLEGQMESVDPRLKMYRSIREGKGAPRPSGSTPASQPITTKGGFKVTVVP